MKRSVGVGLFVLAIVQLAAAAALILRVPAVTRLWPFPYTNQTSFMFVASIFAAAAASTLWCLWTNEYWALTGVALDYLTIFTPSAIFVFQLSASSGSIPLRNFALIAAGGAAFGLWLLLWSRRIPVRDQRPTPRLVFYSFAFFVVALVTVGGQLVLKTPDVMPWAIPPESRVLYGWFFLGAAAYFAHALFSPTWANAGGQLAGFLAYDLVLIVPFLTLLPTIQDHLRPNLIIYIVVVSYSGLLAIYYLFINPDTRVFRRPPLQQAMAGTPA